MRAARLMGWTPGGGGLPTYDEGGGRARRRSQRIIVLDYDHYISHQLLPIAASIADAIRPGRPGMADAGSSQFELDFR